MVMKAESFCIMIPPPNVTGSLHMGHAFQQTIMDTMIRYQRMQGKTPCGRPVPTTQVSLPRWWLSVRLPLKKENPPRLRPRRLYRQNLAVESGIRRHHYPSDAPSRQLRGLGARALHHGRGAFQCRERSLCSPVQRRPDLRGKRTVNWDPKLRTAISDLEVENRESKGSMWHIRYPLADGAKTADGKDYTVVATTRPETLLGDTGVAVNPEDPRYKDLIGKFVVLPLVNRRIPIVGDEHADMEKGTGCVKITPAHDFNDYEVGRRHQLPMINILTFDGDIRESAEVYDTKGNESDVYSSEIPAEFQKLERFAARKAVVAAVDALGLLEEIKPHDLTVPYGDRGGVVIEPMLTDQWYVRADVLAKPAVEAVENGDIQFVPKQYENMYFSGCAIFRTGVSPASCGGVTASRHGMTTTATST